MVLNYDDFDYEVNDKDCMIAIAKEYSGKNLDMRRGIYEFLLDMSIDIQEQIFESQREMLTDYFRDEAYEAMNGETDEQWFASQKENLFL